MTGQHRKCEICGLREKYCQQKLLFARFPLREHICKEWVKAVGKEDLVYLPIEKLHELRHVCGKHFVKRDYTKSKTRLKKNAIPKLCLQLPPLPDQLLEGFPLHLARSTKDFHTTLHLFPNPNKDRERFNDWVFAVKGDIIGLSNEDIFKKRRVCHAHFEEKFCCRFNRISNIAVPTLNLPGNLSTPFTFAEKGPVKHIQDSSMPTPLSSASAAGSLASTELVFVERQPLPQIQVGLKPTPSISSENNYDPHEQEHCYFKQLHVDHNYCKGSSFSAITDHNYHKNQDDGVNDNDTTLVSARAENMCELPAGNRHSDHTYSKKEEPCMFARLIGVEVEGTEIEGIETEGTDIEGTDIEGTEIEETDIEGTEIEETEIEGTEIEYLDEPTEPVKEGPFSWQQSSAVVPCDVDMLEQGGLQDEDMLRDVEQKHRNETRVRTDSGRSNGDDDGNDNHVGYCCNVCEGSIRGFRFMCVQCADYDLCAKCEAKALHSHHYMLRVPPNKDKDEVAEVLQRIRQVLNNCIIHVNDNGEVEVKEENEEIDDPVAVDYETEVVPESDIENPLDSSIEETDTYVDEDLDPDYENQLNASSVEHLENTNRDLDGNVGKPLKLSAVEHFNINSDKHLDANVGMRLSTTSEKPMNIKGPNVENPTIKYPLKTSSAASDVYIMSLMCAKCKMPFDGKTSFHCFQKRPDTSASSLRAWAMYCWPDADWSSTESLKAIPTNSYLCRSHFEEYYKNKITRKRVIKDVTPGLSKHTVLKVVRLQKPLNVQESPSTSYAIRLPNVLQTEEQSIIVTSERADSS